MKTRLVFACAASGIALMAFGATTASAEGANGSFAISPDVVKVGDSVTLSATCDQPDLTVPVPVESGALDPTDLAGEKGADGVWALRGRTTVKAGVDPGGWSAAFKCGDEDVVTYFKIVPTEEPYAAIGIDDKVINPGQEVRVSASCHDSRFVSSKIVSPVVTAPDFVREKDEPVDGVLFSTGKIASDAKPGTYPISFTCVDREISGEFTVTAAPVKNSPKPQVPVKPKGPADTGSLEQSVPDDSSSALLIGAGATALLAAGGGGAWAHRRRGRV
jgi:hypothetical protein